MPSPPLVILSLVFVCPIGSFPCFFPSFSFASGIYNPGTGGGAGGASSLAGLGGENGGGGGTPQGSDWEGINQDILNNPDFQSQAQSSGFWDAVKTGGKGLLDWIGKNPMVASSLLSGLGNAWTGTKGLEAMKDLPNYQAPTYLPSPEYKQPGTPTDYYNDPFVQQNLGQINKQVGNAAAARGMNMSGRTLQEIADNSYSKAILPFMQMQYQNNQFQNQLASGQNQFQNQWNQGQNQFQNQYNYNQGLAQAGATQGYWNGVGNSMNNVTDAWSLQNLLAQQNQQNQASQAASNSQLAQILAAGKR